MTVAAFSCAPVVRVLTVQSWKNGLSRGRPRTFSTRRRVRVTAKDNLYPDVDPPESIENPVTPQGGNVEVPGSADSLFEKLNARRQNRKEDIDVVATSLESAVDTNESFLGRAGTGAAVVTEKTDAPEMDYKSAAKALWRLGWVTWWVQLILTVISGVILLFSFAFPGVNVRSSASVVGFVLSGCGVVLAFLSLFWTYSYTRLSLWLANSSDRTFDRANARITGKLRIGLFLALLGLVVSLTGLQAIVGTLLARLLSAGIATVPYNAYQSAGAGSVAPGTGVVQPVDVLVVQACANAMMALMAALTTTVWLRARAKKWRESINP